MSHQSGIDASPELRTFFNTCKSGSVRLFKVIIKDERLLPEMHKKVNGDWSKDAKAYLTSGLVAADKPCYLFFMLDSCSVAGNDWILLSYIPDIASVREKMLYASTKATLKQAFGQGCIKYDFLLVDQRDVSFGHICTLVNDAAAKSQEGNESSNKADQISGVNHCLATLSPLSYPSRRGVRFHLDSSAIEALTGLRDGKVNFVHLSVDVVHEMIKLEDAVQVSFEGLQKYFATGQPGYYFMTLSADVINCATNKRVFIYALPKMDSSVKERMLYSGCKGPMLDEVESGLIGLKLDRKVEVDSDEVINKEFFVDLFTPSTPFEVTTFSKPKGPSQQRGQRRL